MLDDWAIAWSGDDSANDPERVLALFVDDCVFEDVTFDLVARGKDELRSFVERAFAAVPVPATGKRFSSVRGSTILELEDGKIRREPDDWDAATLMRQIGLLLPRG